ncbi:MAG TPA: substrate-binding domain-containing protein, partial [Polyangiaceae bacterium]|nr:substrate-binding domain-containing protein [Polyangiaceae bacterium]
MLRTRATTIGVLTAEVGNAYVQPILREIDEVAQERNVGLLYFVEWVGPGEATGSRLLTTDLASIESVDALLVLPLAHSLSAEELGRYCERFQPLPICSLADIHGAFASRVSVDNEPGLRAGINHLIQVHGHRSIAFVRGPPMSEEAELRYRVYRDVLEANEIPFDDALVTQGHYMVQSGIDAVKTLLDERGRRPQAIVCANDGM